MKEGCTVLIVDDSRDSVTIAKTILESDGHRCMAVCGAERVLDAVKTYRPDIIFLDVIMPDIDGIELLQKIKKIDNGVKVVMVSGVTDSSICIEAMHKGACSYITKPFSSEQLKTAVITALTKR